MVKHKVKRYHDFSAGHRVMGHDGKCRHLHGHNYRVHFHAEARDLDTIGRVVDFSVLKDRLCEWLEENWDHKMLLWIRDPIYSQMKVSGICKEIWNQSIVGVPFNPTAENMGEYLLTAVGPTVLNGTGVDLVKVEIEETRKCSAVADLNEGA